MALELVYTSAPRGLRLGSSGFCTVACTRGMGPNYVELLESLSGYAPVYPVHDPRARRNPVAHSHYKFQVGGKPVSVLSRVAFAGADYSNRSNKFAHHVVLDMAERPPGGPAWLMRREGFMLERWGKEPGYIERPRKIPQGDAQPAPCDFWERAAGDPGWAGVLAEAFLDAPARPSFVVFEPGAPMLDLVDEALRLLPVERRWDITFNTYFVTLPVGTSCLWRCCLQGAEALKQARRTPGTVLIDLTREGQSSEAARGILAENPPLVEAARTGRLPQETVSVASEAQEETPCLTGASAGPQAPLRLRDEAPPHQRPQAPPPLRVPQRKRRVPWLTLAAVLAFLAVCGLLVFLYLSERGQRLALQSRMKGQEQEIEDLQGQLGKASLETEGLAERVKELEEENERLRTGEETALKQPVEPPEATEDALPPEDRAAEEPEEPDEGNDVAAVPEEPPLRAVAAVGQLRGVSRLLRGDGQMDLPMEGVDSSWRVLDGGWWSGDGPSEGIRVQRQDDGCLHLHGRVAHGIEGEWTLCATIRAVDGAVRFERAEDAKEEHLRKAGIGNLGWLLLAGDSERMALVLRRLPEGEMEMTGGVVPNDEEHYEAKGSLNLPHPLADAAASPKVRWSPASGDEAELSHEWDGGRLEITVELPGVNRDDAAREKLANKKLEIRLDDQTIGSYTLKLAQ